MRSEEHSPDFDGRFSDGRTAASRPVRVRLSGNSLIIEPGAGAPPLTWPLLAIETAEPLTPGAVDVLIHEPGRTGASVFIAEGTFVRTLAVRAPHLTARVQRWRYARPLLIVTAIVAAIVALFTLTNFSPARSVAGLLPHDARVAIGRQVIRSMGAPTCEGADGKAALGMLAKRLSEASGSGKAFNIAVLDSPVVNAFAAPGEEIVIMRRLIDRAESADEIAGVLAHEMGHGIELHPETGIVRAVGLMAITEFILGGTGGTLGNLGLYLTQLGYSRQAEREADNHALTILKSAGISPRGVTDFFRRMGRAETPKPDAKTASSGSPMEILSSHPSTAERIARFEGQPSYPTTPALSPEQWRSLRSICGSPRPSPQAKPASPATKPQPQDAPKASPSPLPPLPKPTARPTGAERDI